jgi:hypothetical protein
MRRVQIIELEGAQRFNEAIDHIDATRRLVETAPVGPYAELDEMLDRKDEIEAGRSEGTLPARPNLVAVDGDKREPPKKPKA